MKNIIAIRREDLSKKGEKRVGVVPSLAAQIVDAGHRLLVQPNTHPESGEIKRAFPNEAYTEAGAQVTEDISMAKVVFGLKEIEIQHIQPNTTYLCFSHTHKGQIKNRKMLQAFKERNTTLIDYELVVNDRNQRVITAFTYFAGYAGQIDTLWTVGKRLQMEGIDHPFTKVPQSIEKEDLGLIKGMLAEIGKEISENGTPAELPPFINLILGEGKTSIGSQEIYDILPMKAVAPADLKDVFENGSRKHVYKCVLGITDMFRLKADAGVDGYDDWSEREKEQLYFKQPDLFESNLDQYLPYATILMNCILWGPEYPRTMSREWTKAFWAAHKNLKAIGDITCDPEGSIQFSKETWIDDPVFIYNPETNTSTDGFEGEGIAVMAVTNLPCEFSSDASAQFSADMADIVPGLIAADFSASLEDAGLPEPFRKAVILWNGEFAPDYSYMQAYLP